MFGVMFWRWVEITAIARRGFNMQSADDEPRFEQSEMILGSSSKIEKSGQGSQMYNFACGSHDQSRVLQCEECLRRSRMASLPARSSSASQLRTYF